MNAKHHAKNIAELLFNRPFSECIVSDMQKVNEVIEGYIKKHFSQDDIERTCDWCGNGGAKKKYLHEKCYESIMNGEGIV